MVREKINLFLKVANLRVTRIYLAYLKRTTVYSTFDEKKCLSIEIFQLINKEKNERLRIF